MAYVPQQIPENEANVFGRKEPTTPNPIPPQTGGSIGGGTAGAGTGTAPGMGTSTQFGSNAAKLSDYLTANKPQVEQFGQQVAGNLNQGYQSALGGINQGIQGFNEQVAQGYQPYNQEIVNQAATNPSEFVKNPQNVSQFQNWYQGTYTGPQNFEGTGFYGDINNQVNKAVENANLVNSPSGLNTYLGNQGYNDTTEGMRTLDAALLTGNPGAITAIKNAAQQYQNLTPYLQNQTTALNQNVADIKNQAQQNATNLQNQFTGQGGIIPTYQENLQNKVINAQNKAQTDRDAAMDIIRNLQSGNVDPNLLSIIGITQPELNTLINENQVLTKYNQLIDPVTGQPYYPGPLDITGYATQNTPQALINTSNVSTPQDYANYAALQQLTGVDLSGTLNPANISQAGTAPMDLLEFNKQGAEQYGQANVKDRDSYLIKQALDIDINDENAARQRVSGLQGYFDNIMNGKIIPYNDYFDPRTQRLIMSIQGLERQGLYTPNQ